ncbi:MAG: helix-turn-helix transcriptional regulator [Salinirussus sp.]
MGFRRLVAATLVLCCCGLWILAAGATTAPGLGPAQQSIDADTVSLRVGLEADGAADWRVGYRLSLDNANETDAFQNLRDDIRADPAPYIERFGDRMRRAARTAENTTGRSMSIRNVSVEASVRSLPQGSFGVVTYRFEWTSFAAVEENRLRAGDAIDELFLDSSTSLTVAWPDGYSRISHRPDATSVENGSVTWQGRRDFGPGEPRVVVAPGPPSGGGDGGGLSPAALAIIGTLGLAALSLLIAIGLWLAGRRGSSGPPAAEDATPPDEPGEAPPEELLSNEERVLRVLEEHGGRVKQQRVAEELDWTAAKTSQVVSDLREAEEIESFRLGRENVLTLPDVSIEPAAEEEDEP